MHPLDLTVLLIYFAGVLVGAPLAGSSVTPWFLAIWSALYVACYLAIARGSRTTAVSVVIIVTVVLPLVALVASAWPFYDSWRALSTGMYEAFVSARLAAETVLSLLAGRVESLDGYTKMLAAAVGSMASASWGAKVALDRYPRATFSLGRSPLAWRVMERMVRGEIAAPSEARGVTRVPLKAIEALARRAGDPGRPYRLEATPA